MSDSAEEQPNVTVSAEHSGRVLRYTLTGPITPGFVKLFALKNYQRERSQTVQLTFLDASGADLSSWTEEDIIALEHWNREARIQHEATFPVVIFSDDERMFNALNLRPFEDREHIFHVFSDLAEAERFVTAYLGR